MRMILLTFSLLTLSAALPLAAQQRTDQGVPGPSWESGKKGKSRDPNLRNVEGVVRLPDDSPAEGAVVKLKNLKTLQIRSFITHAGGKYHFYSLSTNIDYELIAEFKGMSSPNRGLSVFDSRQDAVINLKVEQGKKKNEKSESEEVKQ